MAFMKTAEDWTVWPGYPGYANPAIGEVYQTHVISTMMANAANGKVSPEQAVKNATDQVNKIFKKWRDRGFVGSGSK
jgi:multiple sugar transport system substrate-binding protein